MANRWGNNGNSERLYFLGLQKSLQMVTAAMKLKRRLLLGREAMTNLGSILRNRHYFANKDPSSPSDGFSSSHVWLWELDCKESWALKNWCYWTVVLEKTLESLLDCKDQPVYPKGNQSWVILKLKLQCFGHLMQRADSFEKTLMLGTIEGRKRRGQQDETVGWHHRLHGHGFG